MDVTDTAKSHIGLVTLEPLEHHIHCETNGKILGYRDLVNMDAPVWKNPMCNKLGCISHGWREHAGTDTI